MQGKTTLRFYVAEMTRYAGHDNVKVTLKPAYNNGKGNEDWATATPSGDMWINVNNPSAVKFYEDCMADKADIHITMERVSDLG
jgi:hypothetical protein